LSELPALAPERAAARDAWLALSSFLYGAQRAALRIRYHRWLAG